MSIDQASEVRAIAFATLYPTSSTKYQTNGRDPRSRRQAREYINGVTRQQRWLNFIIDSCYTGKRELDPRVRISLQIGLYDLLFLSTPDYAAINETVMLVQKVVGKNVTGIVNAILRRIQREGAPVPATENPIRDLGIQYSHPDWMVTRWVARYGLDDAKALLEQNNVRPRYSLRVNQLKSNPTEMIEKLASLGVEVTAAKYSSDFLYSAALQDVLTSDIFKEGHLTVQDESAGLVIDVLDPKPGQTIIDMCAAPGGKTTYMLERMNGEGTVLAVDKAEERLELVRDSVQRLGLAGVEYHLADASQADALSSLPIVDAVLLDAPCSGLGVLSKRADMRWRRTERQIQDLIQLQDTLLDNAAARVAPDGVLVYSTCTIEPQENEERIKGFLDRNQSFQLDTLEFEAAGASLTTGNMFRTLPHVNKIDGAFAARLRRCL